MTVSTIDDHQWDQLCGAAPEAGFFHRPEWRAVQGAAMQRFGVLDKKGEVLAAFQLVRSERNGITLWSHPPFTQHCAFLADIRSNNTAKRNGDIKRLHSAVAEFLSGLDGVVTVGFPPEVVDMQPYIWAKCKVVPAYTYRIDLGVGMEAVRANYATETRNVIKKALTDGVEVLPATRTEVLPLIEATFDRKAKALDHAKVDRILSAWLGPASGFAFQTRYRERTVAVAFCGFDAHRAYYLLGGHDKTTGHAGAGALALDRCIREATERGIPQFDLEGSMLPDVERFFRGFGATLTPYYTVNRASFLMEVILKRRWRHLF